MKLKLKSIYDCQFYFENFGKGIGRLLEYGRELE